MPSMEEMVQAHLLNVEREIKTLEERKVSIDSEIERLQSYLTEGVETLNGTSEETMTPEEKSNLSKAACFAEA